jgi:hypothetical protein
LVLELAMEWQAPALVQELARQSQELVLAEQVWAQELVRWY